MKSVFLSVVAVFGVAAASAQQFDHPVTLSVPVYATAICTSSSYNTFQVNFAGTTLSQTVTGPAGTLFSSAESTASLLPGKDYNVTVTSSNCGYVIVFFDPRPGQRIYIEETRQNSYSQGTNFTFRVRAEYLNDPTSSEPGGESLSGLPAGRSSSFPEDKPIWYLGLGMLRDGRYAGAVGFRATSITDSLFNTSSLIFDSVDQATLPVSRDANGYPTQITAHEMVFKFDPYNSTGTAYNITGYAPADTSFATPIVKYTVSKCTIASATGVRIDRAEDGSNWATALTNSGGTWTRYNWQRIASDSTSFDSTTATVTTVSGANEAVVYGTGVGSTSKTKTFSGAELASVTLGTGLTPAQTTTYTYYSSTAANGYPGSVAAITTATGGWTLYDYYNTTTASGALGTVYHVYRPWKDSPGNAGAASASAGLVETYQYTTSYDGTKTAVSDVVTAGNGTQIGHSTKTYTWSPTTPTVNSQKYYQEVDTDYTGAATFLITTTLAYRPDAADPWVRGKPHSIAYPTGRKDSYAYFVGTWTAASNSFAGGTSGMDHMILVFHGQTTGGVSVGAWTNGATTWTMDPVNMVTGYSTVSMTVTDSKGRTVFVGEEAYNGGTLELIAGTRYDYDDHGRVTTETDVIRSKATSHVYSAPTSGSMSFVETVTAPTGVVTKYEYDVFLRLSTTTTGDGALSVEYPAKVQQTTYGAAGLPYKTYTCSCGTTPTVYDYDSAGRVSHKYEKSPNDADNDTAGTLVTTYTYPTATSQSTLLPNGGTRVEDYYLDGQAKSVTGSAQPTTYWDYDVNSTGIVVTQTADTSDLNNGGSITQYDYLNRVVTQSTPAYSYNSTSAPSNLIDVTSTYDDTTDVASPKTGNLILQHTTYRATSARLLPDALFTYDSGRLTAKGSDINEDGSLTAASNDRFVSYDQKLVKDSSNIWWTQSDASTYATLNSNASTLASETKTQLTGFSGSTIATIQTKDAAGRTTTQTTTVDSANKRTTTQTTVTGVTNSAYSATDNGYDSTAQLFSGELTKRSYDSEGRLYAVYSRGAGTTNPAYTSTDTYTYYGSTQYIHVATVGGIVSTYSYSWQTDGRTVTRTDASSNSSYTRYNTMDQPIRYGGAGVSATAVGYDTYGRRNSVTTYRDGTHTEADWPSSGDTTNWDLDPATGLVNHKRYADYATTNNQVGYTYTALGQVKTRTWARGPVATYNYYDASSGSNADVSYRTQELSGITYSNDGSVTPGVSFTYKRSGAAYQVTDAAGTRTFAYTSNPFLLDTETLDASFYHSRAIQRQYDSAMRDTGFTMGSELSQNGSYVAANGLYDHVTDSSSNGTISGTRTFTYGYKPSSGLVDNYATGNWKTSYDYDATSAARRSRVEGDWSSSARTRFDMAYEGRGYKLWQKQSGSAFNDYYSGMSYSSVYNWYSYDARGQLQTAAMYRGTPPTLPTVPASADQLPGRRFEYRYDGAGNRLTAGQTGAASSGDNEYSPNSLNQYDWVENNNVHVLGTAAAASTISASSSGTTGSAIQVTRLDRNFSADGAPANASPNAPVKGTMTITASQSGTSNSTSRDWLIASQHQTLQYDKDGNLTNDGLWLYTYDAENRVVQMDSQLPSGQGYTRLQLKFKYDYLGRRIEKYVKNLDTSAVTFDRRFLYDGWNLVAELDSTGTTIQRTFTWGLDLAGSWAATGGVGGLLQITDLTGSAAKSYYPTYDGNGNVSALIDAGSANGDVVGLYEYSPFGELLRREEPASGGYAKANPFRFSTKYTDEETGLVYYGYRYYSPTLGRFINRDPIEELGGINVHEFLGNNPVSFIDMFGMQRYCMIIYGAYYTTTDTGVAWHDVKHCFDIPDAITIWQSSGSADPANGTGGGNGGPVGNVGNSAPKKLSLADRLKKTLCDKWQNIIDSLRRHVNAKKNNVDLAEGLTIAEGRYGEADFGLRAAVSYQYTVSFPKGGGFMDIRLGLAVSKPVVGQNGITDAGVGSGRNVSISPVGSPEMWNGRSLEVGSNVQPLPAPGLNFLSLGYGIGNISDFVGPISAPVHTFSYGLNFGLSPMDFYLGNSDTNAKSYSLRDLVNLSLDKEQLNHDRSCK